MNELYTIKQPPRYSKLTTIISMRQHQKRDWNILEIATKSEYTYQTFSGGGKIHNSPAAITKYQ